MRARFVGWLIPRKEPVVLLLYFVILEPRVVFVRDSAVALVTRFMPHQFFILGGGDVSELVGRSASARASTENPRSVFFFCPALHHPHIG